MGAKESDVPITSTEMEGILAQVSGVLLAAGGLVATYLRLRKSVMGRASAEASERKALLDYIDRVIEDKCKAACREAVDAMTQDQVNQLSEMREMLVRMSQSLDQANKARSDELMYERLETMFRRARFSEEHPPA